MIPDIYCGSDDTRKKNFFNSSSCFVDLLYAKKYIDDLKGRNKIYVDEADVRIINGKKPYWFSFQNTCNVVSFDGHNIVSVYFPKHKVICGNCFMGKCELIKVPLYKQ